MFVEVYSIPVGSPEWNELEELAKLPIEEIEKFPKDKKYRVYSMISTQAARAGKRAPLKYIMLPIMYFETIVPEAQLEFWPPDMREWQRIYKVLFPYLEAEIYEHPELYDENPIKRVDTQYVMIAAARRARADGKDIVLPYEEEYLEQHPEEAERIKKITYKTSPQVSIVTDKFARVFFANETESPHNSQTNKSSVDLEQLKRKGIPVRYEHKNAKKEITLYYDFVYDERLLKAFGIEKGFSDYDFLVSAALDNLKEQGNTQVSLTKLWHETGGTGKPNTTHLSELAKSIQKGISTTVFFDDTEVRKAWGYDTSFELVSPVMPAQMLKEKYIANGQIADAYINITGYSPFYLLGRSTQHVSTWDKEVLKLYDGKRTKRYYSVFRFLIAQIGWLRNEKSKRSNKILYETLYEHTGANNAKDKQKAREQTLAMFYKIIDTVFIPTGYVKSRREDTTGKPGVILTVSKTGQRKMQNQSNILPEY